MVSSYAVLLELETLHVRYIMQQAYCAASIDTPMALGIIGARLPRLASSYWDCCNINARVPLAHGSGKVLQLAIN